MINSGFLIWGAGKAVVLDPRDGPGVTSRVLPRGAQREDHTEM